MLSPSPASTAPLLRLEPGGRMARWPPLLFSARLGFHERLEFGHGRKAERAQVRTRVDRSVGKHHISRSFGFIPADDVGPVVGAARLISIGLFGAGARRRLRPRPLRR